MTKSWKIKSAEGKKFEFLPVFEAYENPTQEGKDVECTNIIIKIDDEEYTFNFLNLYQFIYFICNEELRQQLMTRYQRRVNQIPYDVHFKLSEDEIKNKSATRRIEIPIDEISMAIARNEAWKLMPKVAMEVLKGKMPFQLFKKK